MNDFTHTTTDIHGGNMQVSFTAMSPDKVYCSLQNGDHLIYLRRGNNLLFKPRNKEAWRVCWKIPQEEVFYETVED